MIDKRINEVHGDLVLIARSKREPNGYLHYYWCKCKCGNIKRYRYDQARKNGSCGMCSDYIASGVSTRLKEIGSGKEE